MTQFEKEGQRPMRPSAYRAAAKRLREFADQLDARADAEAPRERAALTGTVHRLAQFARALSQRHRRSNHAE